MTKEEMIRITEALIKNRDEILANLRKHRVEEVRIKSMLEKEGVAFGEIEDRMARMHRTRSFEILKSEEWGTYKADPRSPDGQTSKDWADLYVENALRYDETWNEMIKSFYDMQQTVAKVKSDALESQSNAMTFQEMLMSNSQEMRLRAALWQAIGGADA